jgi:integrase
VGVSVRKKEGKWYVFVNHNGQRRAKCIGDNRAAAVQVKRVLEAKLAMGDMGIFSEVSPPVPTFGDYADVWLKDHARLVCKPSTVAGYEGVLGQYLRPAFNSRRLVDIKRSDIKALISDMISKELARSTVRNALSVLSGIFNHAIEESLLESNPAANLGRYTRSARTSEVKGVALTAKEVEKFLSTAKLTCPEYQPLFLLALRAGLRRGELVALQWGDVEFGKSDSDKNRFILVRHNYVRRRHTTTKSKKTRRVDMSRDLRGALKELRDERARTTDGKEEADILTALVFPSSDGKILDPDNLYHRLFIPILAASGIRKIRLHDLRHTFGSQLIQNGASIVYVKEQMGHSSIQVTVDIYGHLIPGANVSFVDRLDEKPAKKLRSYRQPSATPAQLSAEEASKVPTYVVDFIGGGGRDRTADLRVMNPSL